LRLDSNETIFEDANRWSARFYLALVDHSVPEESGKKEWRGRTIDLRTLSLATPARKRNYLEEVSIDLSSSVTS